MSRVASHAASSTLDLASGRSEREMASGVQGTLAWTVVDVSASQAVPAARTYASLISYGSNLYLFGSRTTSHIALRAPSLTAQEWAPGTSDPGS